MRVKLGFKGAIQAPAGAKPAGLPLRDITSGVTGIAIAQTPLFQRSKARSSPSLASTQREPCGPDSRFQKGAWVFR